MDVCRVIEAYCSSMSFHCTHAHSDLFITKGSLKASTGFIPSFCRTACERQCLLFCFLFCHRAEVYRHGTSLCLPAQLNWLQGPAHGRGSWSHVRGQQRLHPLPGPQWHQQRAPYSKQEHAYYSVFHFRCYNVLSNEKVLKKGISLHKWVPKVFHLLDLCDHNISYIILLNVINTIPGKVLFLQQWRNQFNSWSSKHLCMHGRIVDYEKNVSFPTTFTQLCNLNTLIFILIYWSVWMCDPMLNSMFKNVQKIFFFQSCYLVQSKIDQGNLIKISLFEWLNASSIIMESPCMLDCNTILPKRSVFIYFFLLFSDPLACGSSEEEWVCAVREGHQCKCSLEW